jgi:hypothetical protein
VETLSLFKELDNPVVAWKAAVAADVEAAGGAKTVAAILWPDDDLDTAHRRLLNACNPKQKQELGYHDIQRVKLIARKKTGASHVHAYESKPLKVELHWVTVQEEVQQVTVNLTSAVQGLHGAIAQANDLLVKLSEVSK